MTATLNTTTVRSFIEANGVLSWSCITDGEREYVFTGSVFQRMGDAVAYYVVTERGLSTLHYDWSGNWDFVRVDGEVKMADATTRRLAASLIIVRFDLDFVRGQRDKMQADWEMLNRLLNEEAPNRDWCNVYDECVDSWTERFALLSLEPRVRDYEVEVEITATWTVRVPVSGMADEDAAMEYVSENYTSAECLSAAGDSWSTPDDTNMEVQRADLA